MKYYFRISSFILIFLASLKMAYAVPPPDFIFNVGAQVVQVFSIVALFFSAALASVSQFAKVYLARIQNKYVFWGILVVIALSISGASAYFYGQYQQNNAYQQWIADSKQQNQNSPVTDNSLDALKIIESGSTTDNSQITVPKLEKIPRPRDSKYESFIRGYYNNLANGNIDAAYAVSKKSVSIETYRGWYKDVSSVIVDDIQEIEALKYSLSLTLTETNISTRYGVLMVLNEDVNGTLYIVSSEVRVLSEAGENQVTDKPIVVSVPAVPQIDHGENAVSNDSYWLNNQNLTPDISDQEFQTILNNGQQIFVLDAREDEEYAIGKFPGSTHIRFADLLAGEWISLPTNQVVYVFCWSGIRGQEVEEFLRSKKIVSQYIKTGADGWVSFGGLWEGGIKFTSAYTDDRYTRLFDLDELKQKISEGVVIVDSRMNSRYESWHIPDSINIPTIYTPTGRMDETLSQVPTGKAVITVCDDFVSCFDAKLTGVKLEKKGHEFLGRYNKPWEYRSSQ